MSARAAILARVSAAARTARLPRPAPVEALETPSPAAAECLERFRAELQALGVDSYVEPTAEAVRRRLGELTAGKRVLSWDAEHLPYEAGSALEAAATGTSPREEQARAEVGVTGCDGAIAETGSLALLSGPGRSRAVSLLPPLHVALVRPEQLCFGMGEFLARSRERIDAAACLTFVTGPSRTADIELTLTLGVHGPGRVIVVIGP